ncbi:divergent polysaccharide deacetylase family protein [Treponema sp. TIM-1]|uniref:divergent polysaccharide deacetylase family protein n=1 Tax=Treponema sp. TIM-1 TaxID=2898417 RepID=UPI00397F3CBB
MVEKRSKRGAVPAGKKAHRRKKRTRKALVIKDQILVVLIAVALIGLAMMISVITITLHSAAPEESVPVSAGPLLPAEEAAEPPEEIAAPVPPAERVRELPVAESPPVQRSPEPPPAKSPPEEAPARVKTPPAEPPPRVTPAEPEQPHTPAKPPAAKPVEPLRTAPISPGAGPPERPGPARPKVLVFIIDDAGNNLAELDPFLRFPGPLTIAVLPGLPHSAEAARRIRAAGKEVFLHQPMEALGGQNPGPGAIYTGMNAGEIRAIVERNLAEIGPVAGMNNHQGSKITMEPEIMEIILALCREHRIYFLDSRTTADTAAPAVAKRMGIKIGERDVFLDNIQEKAAMIRYVQDGLRQADRKGSAVMIGHTWSTELAETLEELYPDLVEEGYSLSTISRFMMGTASLEEFW